MGRARDEAYGTGTRRDQALALTELGRALAKCGRDADARHALELGRALAKCGRDADARHALEQGLRRAEP